MSDENDFLLKFKEGIYRGYVFLMKKDGSLESDPQPFITSLNIEESILKAQWISWKKATSDEVPHPIWQNEFKSHFQEEDVYKNVIGFSEEALGPMFISYFGKRHSCMEGTMLISSKKFDTAKIEGNLYCRTSLHDFILIGLFSLSIMPQ